MSGRIQKLGNPGSSAMTASSDGYLRRLVDGFAAFVKCAANVGKICSVCLCCSAFLQPGAGLLRSLGCTFAEAPEADRFVSIPLAPV